MLLALDFGKSYLVLARPSGGPRPEVAALGDGGRIPALLFERNGGLAFGQPLPSEESPWYLEGFYGLLDHHAADYLSGLLSPDLWRTTPEGQTQILVGGNWRAPSNLLAQMFHEVLAPLVDLSGGAPPRLVLAIPPDLDPKLLYRVRDTLHEGGLALAAWIPTPVAIALGIEPYSQFTNAMVLCANVENNALTLGLVEISDGYPRLLASRLQDRSNEIPFQMEEASALLNELLIMAEELAAVGPQDIQHVFLAGEEQWIPHLQQAINERIPASCHQNPSPALTVAMGAARFAERMEGGAYLAQIPSPTPVSQVTLRGVTAPEAEINVSGGRHDVAGRADVQGEFDLLLNLHTESLNELHLVINVPDGTSFSHNLAIEHASWSPDSSHHRPAQGAAEVTALADSRGLLFSPIGLQISQEFVALIPSFSALPYRGQYRFPLSQYQEAIPILEGPTAHSPTPQSLGKIVLPPLPPDLTDNEFVEVELICNQDRLIEAVARLEGRPDTEAATLIEYDPSEQPQEDSLSLEGSSNEFEMDDDFEFSDEDFAKNFEDDGEFNPFSDDDFAELEASLGEEERSPEEATQPDMEVPPEMLAEGDSLLSSPPSTPPPSPPSSPSNPALSPPPTSSPFESPSPPPPGASPFVREVPPPGSSPFANEEPPPPPLPGTPPPPVPAVDDEPTALFSIEGLGYNRDNLAATVQANEEEVSSETAPPPDALSTPPPSTSPSQEETVSVIDSEDFFEEINEVADEDVISEVADEDVIDEVADEDVINEVADEDVIDEVADEDVISEAEDLIEDSPTIRPPDSQSPPPHQPTPPPSASFSAEDSFDELRTVAEEEEPPLAARGRMRQLREKEKQKDGPDTDSRDPQARRSLEELADAVKAATEARRRERLRLEDHDEEEEEGPPSSEEIEPLSPLAAGAPEGATLAAESFQEDSSPLSGGEQHKAEQAEMVRQMTENAVRRAEEKRALRRAEEEPDPAPPLAPLPQEAGLTPFESASQKMEQALRLAEEAQQMVRQAQALAEEARSLPVEQGWQDTPSQGKIVPLQGNERRDVRKILEMAHNLTEVEQNRLPGSSRKTIQRLVGELESHVEDEDGRKALRFAIQLANRLFEIIRRDLRSW